MSKTIAKASLEQKWDVKLSNCMKIWRAGCIIQSGECSKADYGALRLLLFSV